MTKEYLTETPKVVIVNRTNGLPSKPLDLRTAQKKLAQMLKWWRIDCGDEPFPYCIESLS